MGCPPLSVLSPRRSLLLSTSRVEAGAVVARQDDDAFGEEVARNLGGLLSR